MKIFKTLFFAIIGIQIGWADPYIIRDNFSELDGSIFFDRHLKGCEISDFDEILLQDTSSSASIKISLKDGRINFSVSNWENFYLLVGIFDQFYRRGWRNVKLQDVSEYKNYDYVEIFEGVLFINVNASWILANFALEALNMDLDLKGLNFRCLRDEYFIEKLISSLEECTLEIEKVELFDISDISVFCNALSRNFDLREFSLTSCLGCDLQPVAELLKTSFIRKLSITEGDLDDRRLMPLIDALRKNKTIEELNLSSNHIGDEGARMLADLLRENSNIKKLSLVGYELKDDEGNFIGNFGALYFTNVLTVENHTLEELNLCRNEDINDKVKTTIKMLMMLGFIQANVILDACESEDSSDLKVLTQSSDQQEVLLDMYPSKKQKLCNIWDK